LFVHIYLAKNFSKKFELTADEIKNLELGDYTNQKEK
jgi:hypothetical protein